MDGRDTRRRESTRDVPTIFTPCADGLKAVLTRIPSTSASSPPGIFGAFRSAANKSTSAPAPTASVAPLVSPGARLGG